MLVWLLMVVWLRTVCDISWGEAKAEDKWRRLLMMAAAAADLLS